jgi:hypothetical protein
LSLGGQAKTSVVRADEQEPEQQELQELQELQEQQEEKEGERRRKEEEGRRRGGGGEEGRRGSELYMGCLSSHTLSLYLDSHTLYA